MNIEYKVWLEVIDANLNQPSVTSIEMERFIKETIIENKENVLLTIEGVVSFKLCYNNQTHEYYQLPSLPETKI